MTSALKENNGTLERNSISADCLSGVSSSVQSFDICGEEQTQQNCNNYDCSACSLSDNGIPYVPG